MADSQNFLELSDEDFLKQGAAMLDTATSNASAASAADAAGGSAGDQGGQGEQGNDDAAEQQRLADEEAARMAAEQNQDNSAQDQDQSGQGGEQGAAATAAGTGDAAAGQDGKKEGEVNDDALGNDAGAVDADGKKRGPDGKFVKQDPATAADPATKSAGDTDNKQDPAAIDYKAEYEKLTAPFKANGRDLRVENVDEAVRLMQMGANYNRKMAALKPNLAIMKMLENNGLLSPEKIGFLIDLDKKNPEAISKLIKDSGVDPLDISVEKAGEYKPGNHGVNEAEVELDTVLDDLKSSPKLTETLDLVGNQWDAKSRQLIAAQPQLLKVINGHMESGVFDLVATELERKRLFGGLQGLSDLEAYRQVGDEMASNGKFDHMQKKAGQPTPAGQQTPVAKTVVTPAPKKADDSKREEQRRAAAPAKGAAPAGKLPADFNPLALSDEEFAKFKPNF